MFGRTVLPPPSSFQLGRSTTLVVLLLADVEPSSIVDRFRLTKDDEGTEAVAVVVGGDVIGVADDVSIV